jgi:excisionase family DNA binding protein
MTQMSPGLSRREKRAAARPLSILAVSPEEAARMLSLGLTRIYALMRAGELASFDAGRARRITTDSIHRYVQRRLAANTDWRCLNSQPPRRKQPIAEE